MSTETIEGTNLEELLDADAPCEVNECANPAEFQLICRLCRHRYYAYCAPHTARVRRFLDIASLTAHIRCNGCRKMSRNPDDILGVFPI